MKTFAFLAATVLAQKNKNNYNNNNNNYNNNSNYGSAYGDPHFMVSSNDQPAICFDYNPEANTRIELLRDPDTSLEVSAATKSTGNKHHEDQVIMSEITLSTPGGAKITMDRDGLHLDASAEAGKRDSFTGVFDFADAKIVEHKAPNGSMDRAHIQVGDAVFIIKATKKGSMSFAIREPRVIDENNAEIILNGGKLDATKKDFHRTADCWVVDDDLAQFNDLIKE
ncbi:Oidioi.mRNA.OKI2018_I69.XSR.g16642.t1.cds [Oikopleura dioica]|uniref:Oidioi.mRNA.OKI2018_I69.XSR.g16642.t1.cds n=1 Tax=Oikopleura dioica TaxID=34765 RepID=A0ABN7SLY3_OIKDI|nr:Oidioi.mRNA.OKI2018_I69.XSR.g16642.t1.cds [Oikopleura dioica]